MSFYNHYDVWLLQLRSMMLWRRGWSMRSTRSGRRTPLSSTTWSWLTHLSGPAWPPSGCLMSQGERRFTAPWQTPKYDMWVRSDFLKMNWMSILTGQKGKTTVCTDSSWGHILLMSRITLWSLVFSSRMMTPSLMPHTTTVRKEVRDYVSRNALWCWTICCSDLLIAQNEWNELTLLSLM